MPYATNGEIRIHYRVEGSGPPLMMHTGFVNCGTDLYTLGYVDAFKDDYHVILIDPRGQGESDKPHLPEAYGPQHRMADVIAVLDALTIGRVHFWGHSLGGRTGFDLAAHHPGRLSSLIVSGSHPLGSSPEDGASARELLGQGMAHFMEANREVYAQFSPEIYERWLTDDPEALRAALVVEPSLEAHLHAMRLPALIYCGDRDNPTHERARRAAAAMPQAAFLSLPGEDHASSVIASSVVVRLRAFLEARG